MTAPDVTARGGAPPLPGLDGIRLLGALAVLFSHSYLLATGSEATEPFVRLLGEHQIVGLYGVFTFFIISGYLLARALQHDPDPVRYAVHRTLRIYPAFAVCMLMTAFVLGPIVSSASPLAYFTADEFRGCIFWYADFTKIDFV